MAATLVTSNAVEEHILSSITLPERTRSYTPVSHTDFVDNVKDIAGRVLTGYSLHKEQYGIAKEGKQMFGTLTYRKQWDISSSQDMGLSIGIRNSYDKSMSLGICGGASVFVCENLMMSGEITMMRKHSGAILEELKGLIFNVVINSEGKFRTLHADAQAFKQRDLTDRLAYGTMGRLYGNGVFTERMLPIVKREWNKPSHEAFEGNTVWGFYNACTEALKKASPQSRMNKQIRLHNEVKAEYGIA